MNAHKDGSSIADFCAFPGVGKFKHKLERRLGKGVDPTLLAQVGVTKEVRDLALELQGRCLLFHQMTENSIAYRDPNTGGYFMIKGSKEGFKAEMHGVPAEQKDAYRALFKKYDVAL